MSRKNETLTPLFKKTTGGETQLWKISVEQTKDGKGVIVTEYGLLNGKKQTNRETIETGKNVGKKNETTPYQQAMAEAESRWRKQLDRKGYGFTVEESAKVRGSSPMLAKKYEECKKQIDWSTALTQPKFDGHRCLARMDKGKVILLSRENQPIEAPVHIINNLKKILTAGSPTLDGELYCHGMSLNMISSAVKKRSDLTDKIRYHVYDLHDPQDEQPFIKRAERLKEFADFAASTNCIEVVESVLVQDEAELMVCQQKFIEQGFEGAILRHGDLPYEPGKRSKSLLKVKTFQDGEFEVIDAKPGRGKYAGCCIFICQTEAGHTFDVLAHGDIPTKQRLWENYKSFIGSKLTVKYAYYTKTEEPVPFQPVAKGFR